MTRLAVASAALGAALCSRTSLAGHVMWSPAPREAAPAVSAAPVYSTFGLNRAERAASKTEVVVASAAVIEETTIAPAKLPAEESKGFEDPNGAYAYIRTWVINPGNRLTVSLINPQRDASTAETPQAVPAPLPNGFSSGMAMLGAGIMARIIRRLRRSY